MDKLQEWKIVHQNTPFNYTQPMSLVVEASSKEVAFAVAYDYLTRNGNDVDSSDSRLRDLALDVDVVRSYGVPSEYGPCHIRKVIPHSITASGKVVKV